MERPTSKKTKEQLMRANHEGNIKFPNPLLLLRSISNNEKGRTKAIDKKLRHLNPKLVFLHHK
jgi:hypothetical protein